MPKRAIHVQATSKDAAVYATISYDYSTATLTAADTKKIVRLMEQTADRIAKSIAYCPCGNTILSTFTPGKPKRYCSEACHRKFQPRQPTAINTAYARKYQAKKRNELLAHAMVAIGLYTHEIDQLQFLSCHYPRKSRKALVTWLNRAKKQQAAAQEEAQRAG
jgi:hypothetical protein